MEFLSYRSYLSLSRPLSNNYVKYPKVSRDKRHFQTSQHSAEQVELKKGELCCQCGSLTSSSSYRQRLSSMWHKMLLLDISIAWVCCPLIHLFNYSFILSFIHSINNFVSLLTSLLSSDCRLSFINSWIFVQHFISHTSSFTT